MKQITIAIDGFSAAGKSTLGRQLAQRLNYTYVDSGAMYRAVTLFALRQGLFGERLDETGLVASLGQIDLKCKKTASGREAIFLNGKDVTAEIRGVQVATHVSEVAKIPEVRSHLVKMQQAMGQAKAVVMDGRDIGTAVFPDAELKLFVTASPEIRARRRRDELAAKGQQVTLAQVLRDLKKRDEMDTARAHAPLVKAADAIEIDNSHLSRAAQLQKAMRLALYKMRYQRGKSKNKS